MNLLRKKPVPFIVAAVLLSLILHIMLIAVMSGVGGFEFLHPFSSELLITSISRESAPKQTLIARTASQANKQAEQPETKTAANNQPQPAEPTNKPSLLPEEKADSADENTKPETENTTQKQEAIPQEKPEEAPFQILKAAKEKLNFDLYWAGIYVGRAVLDAVNENGTVTIISQVHSGAFLSTFYKINDYAESIVINGAPAFYKFKQEEGRKRSDKETYFDMSTMKVTHINHIKGTNDEYTITSNLLWDVISGFYYLRTMKLEVGQTVRINLFDSNKFYQAEVNVLRKEKIKLSDDKEIDAVVVKPVLKSEGLFESKGNISIWLSDDDLKVPLRVETEVPIGKVVAELKKVETGKEKQVSVPEN